MSRAVHRTARCVPFEEWPASDRAAWQRALRDDDLLEEEGLFARLRPATLLKLRSAYGRWLSFLEEGDPDALELVPARRITQDRVMAYFADLQPRNASITVAHRILSLERAARAFDPGGSWRWLRRLYNRLFLRAKPVRNRRAQLKPPQEVFAAALQLMDTAETGVFTSDKKRAQAFRDALLLAILAARGPRVGNLGVVEIGRHLVRSGAHWSLCFAQDETKNGDSFEPPLPEELTMPLERYLADWRPILLGGAQSNHLWISANGRPLEPDALHFIVTARTRSLFGIAINPHSFRAALATELAIRDPEHVAIASPMLGHRASASIRHYNLAGQHEAARDWQRIVRERRREARGGRR